MGLIEWSREFRSEKFSKAGEFFLNLGISANVMTTISLLLGLGAVYFLFQNLWLFAILGIAHIIADGLDGVIARVSQSTVFGSYYDKFNDTIIPILLLIKVQIHLEDYYVLMILGLYVLANLVYFLSEFKYKFFNSRMVLIMGLILGFPILAYLACGIATVYSLALQLQQFIKTKI